MALIDRTNQKYNLLTVTSRAPNTKGGSARWHCSCSCGGVTIVRGDSLQDGSTKSCGCLMDRTTHGMTGTKLYKVWSSMRERTSSSTHKSYHRYGGRGISICNEWRDFIPFQTWAASSGYADKLTIDRINNDGNYEPTNCRWATRAEQGQNTSTTKLTEDDIPVIRVMVNDGWTRKKVAELFSVTDMTIGRIVNNKRWVNC